LYQLSIQVNTANLASVFVFQACRAISSHAKVANKLSAMAWSYASPTVPIEERSPISLHRLPNAMLVYGLSRSEWWITDSGLLRVQGHVERR